MQVIEPSFDILSGPEVLYNVIVDLERIGRVCYKSEDKINEDSSSRFITQIVKSGHHSVLEHQSITVRFIHNRGFTHELVRHRLASYSQESTRYCNYSKDKFGNELTFIKPYWWDDESVSYIGGARAYWQNTMEDIEKRYLGMLNCMLSPQAARGILPNDLKTEIIMTANLREWMHVFKLRTANAAHPDMRRVMKPLQKELHQRLPEIFTVEEA
jgi:thymidylate synthase (FAD)